MPDNFKFAAPIFAFGLVAFGFLGMGPVTIAVDSYGPVTDNAQSVYELSRIESRPNIAPKSKKNSASSPISKTPSISLKKMTARATPSRPPPNPCSSAPPSSARPRWFSALLFCSTTCRQGRRPSFSIVSNLSLVQPEIILGLLMGGAVIYWFTGASTPGRRHRCLSRGGLHSRPHASSTPPPRRRRTARKSSASAPFMRRKACGTSSS